MEEELIPPDVARERLEDLYLEKITQAMISGNHYAFVYWRVRLVWLHRRAGSRGTRPNQ